MRFAFVAPVLLLLAGAAAADAPAIEPADHVLVRKGERSIELYAQGRLIHRITGIALGFQPTGAKRFAGDGRTPEGRYIIDYGNERSAYHLSLHISYPSEGDHAFAAARGANPGGAIFIHGQPNDRDGAEVVSGDWTDGCIAVSNAEMDLLWQEIGDGTPIEIRP